MKAGKGEINGKGMANALDKLELAQCYLYLSGAEAKKGGNAALSAALDELWWKVQDLCDALQHTMTVEEYKTIWEGCGQAAQPAAA